MKFSQIELEQAIQSITYIQNLSALHFSQEREKMMSINNLAM